jgi:hypothetical protein
MGMNLYPKNDPDGESVDYNWTGWNTLIYYLKRWGVDTSEFKDVNDGDPISADTCRKVSHAIANNLDQLPPDHHHWLKDHPALWRYLADAGGCEQH